MHPTAAHSLNIQRISSINPAEPTGALGRQLRQAKRILAELLEVARDSPTMRLKIADARKTLAELEAQIPKAVAPADCLVVIERKLDVLQITPAPLGALCAAPSNQTPPVLWPPRVRLSSAKQMQSVNRLAPILE